MSNFLLTKEADDLAAEVARLAAEVVELRDMVDIAQKKLRDGSEYLALDMLRAENAGLQSEVEALKAKRAAPFPKTGLVVRLEAGNAALKSAVAQLVAQLGDAKDGRMRALEHNAQLLAENAALRIDLSALEHEEGSLKLSLSMALSERDSQATLAAGYMRERDALRAQLEAATWDADVRVEREACVKVAEQWLNRPRCKATALDIAAAIRARGGA